MPFGTQTPPEVPSVTIRVGATTPGTLPAQPTPTNVPPELADFARTVSNLRQDQQDSPAPREYAKFVSYEYHEDFLVPSDASSFVLADDALDDTDRSLLTCGARVDVLIGGNPQSVSYINKIRARSDRSTGTVLTLECYDWLNRTVKSHVDPQTRFRPSMTLLDLLTAVFEPFGMQVLATDNIANRNAITGRIYGNKTTANNAPLKSYTLHQIKPYPQEGAFAFASRVSQRFGLWLWPAVDGQTVIVGKPDFDQEARYQVKLSRDNTRTDNNVLSADVELSNEDQPSIILASGFGDGGEFAKSKLRSGILNPIVAQPFDSLAAIENAYPNVHFVAPDVSAIASGLATMPLTDATAIPLYLYDPESHTQAELDAFVLRELSLRMRKSLVARYTFEGHALNGQPVAVDTIVDVQDDKSRLNLPMWIQGRRFVKDRSGGTRTTIECIRPGSLVF